MSGQDEPKVSLRHSSKLVHMPDGPKGRETHAMLKAYCKEQGLEMKSFMSGFIKGYILGKTDVR